MKGDEFWDYEKQVDLESFSAPTLYDILSKQARQVTQDLGKQKEEVGAKDEFFLLFKSYSRNMNICWLFISLLHTKIK